LLRAALQLGESIRAVALDSSSLPSVFCELPAAGTAIRALFVTSHVSED
jgi:hypothetical protein